MTAPMTSAIVAAALRGPITPAQRRALELASARPLIVARPGFLGVLPDGGRELVGRGTVTALAARELIAIGYRTARLTPAGRAAARALADQQQEHRR